MGSPLNAIDQTVQAKLKAQRGHEEALALWLELWAAYAEGGPDGAAALLEKLRSEPRGAEEHER